LPLLYDYLLRLFSHFQYTIVWQKGLSTMAYSQRLSSAVEEICKSVK
jgi:hypothetical protein